MYPNLEKSVFMKITIQEWPMHVLLSNWRAPPTKKRLSEVLNALFTSNLLCNKHIDAITRKASARLDFLRRSLKLALPKLKHLSYKTLVWPVLECAFVIWYPFTASNISSLQKIQRKAVRFIYNKYWVSDSTTYFCTLADHPTLNET